MKTFLTLAILLCAAPVFAQNTATATITINRNSAVSQTAANQALSRDIERFMLERYSGINGATAKSAGVCTSFAYTETRANGTTRAVDLEIYNRDANTCLPVLTNGKTDLLGVTSLGNVLQRAFRLLFDEITDVRYVKDKQEEQRVANQAELSTRVAEKP